MSKGALPARWMAWLGALVSAAGMLTYFTVAVRWPDLRDSGHANVALAAAGAILSLAGTLRASSSPSGRRGTSILASGLSLGFTGVLAFYVYWLSYQLPPAEAALAVGTRAPEFRLPDQEGRETALAGQTAEKLILVFFRGHW